MKLKTFVNIKTAKVLKNTLNILYDVSKEQNLSYEDLLKIEDTKYDELRYILSSIKGDYVMSHFFLSWDKKTDLCGLCEMSCVTGVLFEWCKPIYNKVTYIHKNIWICLREDLFYDVIVNGRTVLKEIQSYDITSLGDCLQFIKLDYNDKTSLICLDLFDIKNGVYYVESEEDFIEWFTDKVSKRGYEGKLDDISISQLFQIYFEIINEVFTVSNFEPLEIQNDWS